MVTVRAKAPLRISFSGGGTDISPFKDEFGGCVLSTTINKYVYATLTKRIDGKMFIHSHDLNVVEEFNYEIDGQLVLVKGVLKHIAGMFYDKGKFDGWGFDLYIKSDAPVGSGLGSSSTLVVCLIKLLYKAFAGKEIDDYELASLAYHIERNILGIKGGYQDQYASTFGGFNFIEFGERVVVNPLRIKRDTLYELEHNLLLCYTGKTRKGQDIIDKQVKGYPNNIEALIELQELTYEMKAELVTGNLTEFGNLLHKAWVNKKKLTSSISNTNIDNLYEIGRKAGAIGGKLLGAGGGGYILLYCEKDKFKVADAMREAGCEIVDFNFDYKGCVAWKS